MSLKKQPVYLNLLEIRFPVMAICSILHRISGVLIFFATPFALWFLYVSLKSPEHFENVVQCLSHPAMRFGIWAVGSAFLLHTFAGVRHLIMDLGIGESLAGGRSSAKLVLLLFVLSSVILGWALWS